MGGREEWGYLPVKVSAAVERRLSVLRIFCPGHLFFLQGG